MPADDRHMHQAAEVLQLAFRMSRPDILMAKTVQPIEAAAT
jgi:hypothetical protein